MIGLGLGLELGLEHKLTPQQVQYLKLLQLTGLQLEQYISQELEMNPMLEEGSGEADFGEETELSSVETINEDAPNEADRESEQEERLANDDTPDNVEVFDPENGVNDEEQTWVDFIEDESSTAKYNSDDEDDEGFPMPDSRSVLDDLEDQLRLLDLSEEEEIICEEILGSIEPSGYLYRDLAEIVIAVNDKIAALNELRKKELRTPTPHPNGYYKRDYMDAYNDDANDNGDFESLDLSPVKRRTSPTPAQTATNAAPLLQFVNVDMVETMLFEIQTLDPPGIGSRDLRECLLAQLYALPKRNAAQQLAKLVLEKTYDAFRMKHFEVIMRELKVSEVYLREALKAIRALNPKPGGLETGGATSSIIPDFFISFDEDKSDFIIQLNDARVPTVRVNRMYEQMKNHVREFTQRGMKSQRMNKDTRKFLKQKYDDAKFLILALKQRRHTMIRVMTAIVYRQREFFLRGKNYMRPLIYKDIAEDTGVDISTVCRVVNNKYAQTDFGVYELRYFFSEGMPMPKDPVIGGTLGVAPIEPSNGHVAGDDHDGETEVSTRVIKEKLKELIAAEPKGKPLSDDKLVQELAKLGFTIARRTVAKYRDLAGIPPARLRREL